MTDCARCAWRPDPDSDVSTREQAQVHAADLGHPRCCCCSRSLVRGELGTCETREPGDGTPCLQTAREHLSGIRTLYDDLGSYLGHLRGPRLDSSSPSASDGRPLPGGDVLALLGPGSRGDSEDGHTSKDGDPVSVAYELTWWAEDWADRFGDRAADVRPRTPAAQIRQALAYLERRMRQASREHPAYDDFATDLRNLHRTLERAAGRDNPIQRAEAECFGCATDNLIRELTDSGYPDEWTCRRCGQVYDWSRYLLALRESLQQTDDDVWGLPDQVAYVIGVRQVTVRQWITRGLVTSACTVHDHRLRVLTCDALVRAEALNKRRRKQTEAVA